MNHIVKFFVEKSCDPITAQYYLKDSKIRGKNQLMPLSL
jgi:hypothetical protein